MLLKQGRITRPGGGQSGTIAEDAFFFVPERQPGAAAVEALSCPSKRRALPQWRLCVLAGVAAQNVHRHGEEGEGDVGVVGGTMGLAGEVVRHGEFRAEEFEAVAGKSGVGAAEDRDTVVGSALDQLHAAAREALLHERQVEPGVMRHQARLAGEIHELEPGLLELRRVGDHGVVDAGQRGQARRDGHAGIHERLEPRNGAVELHADRADFDDAVADRAEAGRFEVEDGERSGAEPVHGGMNPVSVQRTVIPSPAGERRGRSRACWRC